ncbi:amino acid ABC transporter substrate-binding protein [Pseudomonas sp. MSSRFD41]|uniref:ABC transporter substrate-binding protein n=1 Tax=Pseudomonas sp. MSSRFD41 TaxID=1310370 RepID=UPI0016396201|nr:transporter substrate-binding domain-containing protein [Pseudomonas sp. MSSRFD41]MBC2659569.1 amino acid ABC transporter substrate-binding protein [Pseudomonas sp. MSSRFD41]
MNKIRIVPLTALVITFCSLTCHAASLQVAVNQANPPYEFEDSSGVLTGFEVEVVEALAQRLNKNVEFSSMPFNMLFASVQSGRVDIAIGGITITAKRLENVTFTQPFIDSNQCVTTLAKGTIRDVSQLAGKDVGVITGTVGEIWASKAQKEQGFNEIRRYDGNIDPMMDLASGRTSATVNDCPITAWYIKDKPQFTIIHQVATGDKNALMLPRNSPLLSQLNQEISRMKTDGSLAGIYRKWFNTQAQAHSSTAKIEPIPGH